MISSHFAAAADVVVAAGALQGVDVVWEPCLTPTLVDDGETSPGLSCLTTQRMPQRRKKKKRKKRRK